MVDILALQKRIAQLEAEVTRLSKEKDQQTAMLIYADLRINKMVKERSHETRGNIGNASR